MFSCFVLAMTFILRNRKRESDACRFAVNASLNLSNGHGKFI